MIDAIVRSTQTTSCSGRPAGLAPYKRIRAVRFAAAIPRTPSGKILRRVLLEQERQTV